MLQMLSYDDEDGLMFGFWPVNLSWSVQQQQFLIEHEQVSTNLNLTNEHFDLKKILLYSSNAHFNPISDPNHLQSQRGLPLVRN